MKILSKKLIKLPEKIKVYCLTNETTSNFCLENGLVVKNCGKTSVSIITQFYNLFRMTSLKKPQQCLGSAAAKPMTILCFGITLSTVNDMRDGFVALLRSCKYFKEVDKLKDIKNFPLESGITPFYFDKNEITLCNNINIKMASRAHHSIGKDLFGCIFDESEYRINSSTESTTELYLEVTKRIQSRFLGRRFILVNLVSSIRSEHGVIAQYIKNGGMGENYTKIVSMSLWDFQASCGKIPKECLTDVFYVMRGTKSHPSRILDSKDSKEFEDGIFRIPTGCDVLKIPRVFFSKFKLGVNKSLMDIAGVSIATLDSPFDDFEGLEDKNLMEVITIEASLKNDESLIDKLPREFFSESPLGLRLKRFPEVKRYGHLDMADTGEAALSVVHKEKLESGKQIIVTDFLVKIISPDRINFESVLNFIVDLKRKLGINFEILSADQYQSTAILQYLDKNKIARTVKKVSVDTTLEAYSMFSSLVSEKSLRIGRMNELRTQLNNIYFDYEANTKRGKPRVHMGRKDLCDAEVGACFNALMNPEDVPINIFKDNSVEELDNIKKYFDNKNYETIELTVE